MGTADGQRDDVPAHRVGADPASVGRGKRFVVVGPVLVDARHDRPGNGQPDDAAIDGPRRSWRAESPRSMLRYVGGYASAASPSQISISESDDKSSPADVQEAAVKLKRRVKSGPSMRDELVEIVRDDPDAAANILRSWIGGAT